MKPLAAVVLALCVVGPAGAHPGSGILADHGAIYFIDTGAGLWKIDAAGALSRAPGSAFHWFALDHDNRFAKTPMPRGSGWEIARAGSSPTILTSSDFPIALGTDGNLYYPASVGKNSVEIRRLTPSGATSPLAKLAVDWINGLAAGPGGALYVSEDKGIRRIASDGSVTTIVSDVTLPKCSPNPLSEPQDGPYLRGLDVDAKGSIVVAATNCGAVLRIAPDGKKTETLLQLDAPWSPTAVTRVGTDVYVLEYLHVGGDDRQKWIPRVRKISPDGKSAIVATVERP